MIADIVRRTLRASLALAVAAAAGLAGAATAAPAPRPAAQSIQCSWRDLGNLNRNVAYAASAMDTVNDAMYVYGGYNDPPSFQTDNGVSSIAFGATLSRADTTAAAVPVSGPQEREALAGVFRPRGDDSAVYWIGGRDNTGKTSDQVQVLTVKTRQWSVLPTGGTFGIRDEHAAAYDPKHDAIWVAAGETTACTSVPCTAPSMPTNYLTFDPATGAATWNVGPTGGPRAKGGTMVYDSKRERMVFFGGTIDGDRGTSQIFALDLSDADVTKAAWAPLGTTGVSPSVAVHSAVYDPEHDWMVVYGGMKSGYAQAGGESVETRTFALDFAASPPAWRNLNASVGERLQAVMEYVPKHKAVVLTAGRNALPDPIAPFNKRTIHGLTCVTSAPPTAVPTRPSGTGEAQMCDRLTGRVPAAAIAEALANPDSVGGWNQRCFPGLPEGPNNGLRQYLGLTNPGLPFHPLFNTLIWRCGCR